MSGILGHRGLLLKPAGGGGGGTLYDEIIADSPALYFRHAEASGSTMENEVGTDGSYISSPPLGQPALYSGGPTCMLASSNRYGRVDFGTFPMSLTAFSIVTVAQFNDLTGFRGIISRDPGGGSRQFQWRMNGTQMEFVKIAGSVESLSQSGALTEDVPHIIGLTVSAVGEVKFYVDGANIFTGSVSAANYGTASSEIEIGYMTGGGGASANAYFSESALFAAVISGTRMADYATAAGF